MSVSVGSDGKAKASREDTFMSSNNQVFSKPGVAKYCNNSLNMGIGS